MSTPSEQFDAIVMLRIDYEERIKQFLDKLSNKN